MSYVRELVEKIRPELEKQFRDNISALEFLPHSLSDKEQFAFIIFATAEELRRYCEELIVRVFEGIQSNDDQT